MWEQDDDDDGCDECQMIDAGIFNFFLLNILLESRVSEHVHVSSCLKASMWENDALMQIELS